MALLELLMVALSLITVNVNGMHDQLKWTTIFKEILHQDIICFQETHLESSQEYAFELHTQGYDLFFGQGATNAGGVCVGVCRS